MSGLSINLQKSCIIGIGIEPQLASDLASCCCCKAKLAGWKRVCSPQKKGGAGVVNLRAKNQALLAKWGWRFATEKRSLLRKAVKAKYGSLSNDWFLNADDSRNVSVVWKGILKNCQHGPGRRWLSFDSFKWRLGNGRVALFWEDWWCGNKPLRCSFPRLYKLSSAKGRTMFEVVKGKSLFNIEWKDMFTRPLLDREKGDQAASGGTCYGGNTCSRWDRQEGLVDTMVVSEVKATLLVVSKAV
ncbi:hypothetical protein V6N13_020322 [Hibiscus sabdariffa]